MNSKQNLTEKKLRNELDDIFNAPSIPSLQKIKFNKHTKKTKLVMSGGGIKGICHIGALKALEDIGLLKNITTYVGSSAGAMAAVFLYIGYSAKEIYELFEMINLSKVKDIAFTNLLTQYGIDNGKPLEMIFEKLCLGKNVDPKVTFKEMFNKTHKTLIITTTCVNDKKVHYLSHETTPNLRILTALRMSISIPIYFTPVRYKKKYYIDGACIDSFPIHLFNDNLDEVIGLFISDVHDNVNNINNIEEYLYHTIQCLLEGHSINSIKGYEHVSINIISKNMNAVDFSLNKTAKQKLFDIGYNTAMSYYT